MALTLEVAADLDAPPERGDHAFYFEPRGAGCHVRSVEVWTGLLVRLMAGRLRKVVPVANQAQLEGLRKALVAGR